MGLYSLSIATTATGADVPAWEIRSTSGNKPKLLQMELTQETAAAGVCTYGIGIPKTVGVTPTSPAAFVDESDGNAPSAFTTAAVAWGTAPTVPAAFNRRFSVQSSPGVGRGFIAIFPAGFGMPVNSSIVLWLLANGVVSDVAAIVNE